MIPNLPIRMMVKSLTVAVAMAIPPAFLPSLVLSPDASAGARVALYFGVGAVWIPLLLLVGAFRWSSLGVWRPGFRPCLCDQPVRCHRHHSSPYEPNRPGVVAARLAQREDA